MNVNLHIERLVLDGVGIEPGQRHLLKTSVEKELTRLLAESGLSSGLAAGVALPGIGAGNIQFNDGGNPAQMGQKIAQSLHGGISRE